ncbi:hexokinase-3 isoform X2 [Dermochelys coriacea]|uniref:hexokinase-3 isoform X2 n=1 Tax=Dermochelys coriacea TaxID=27794 RepID=UPI001CA8DF6F|nr:hexokinase-3 isoform X2 [Dermochelys coriacea]
MCSKGVRVVKLYKLSQATFTFDIRQHSCYSESWETEWSEHTQQCQECPQPRAPTPAPMQSSLQPLCLSLEKLHRVKDSMLEAMDRGLSRRTHAQATVRMLPNFIRSTPDERGEFLVLELRDTDLRVLLVELSGDTRQMVTVKQQLFPVSDAMAQGPGEELFAYMATCLCEFLDRLRLPRRAFQLGFSFPFHCRQTRLDQSYLISWTKSFKCPGVEGRDVVELLQNAINKQDRYPITVIAVVNDTTGTMMSCEASAEPCEVGLVVDAGTNSCFMAEARHVEMVEESEGRMGVVTEWGSFGDDGTLNDMLSPYDRLVDEASLNPGKSRFEKMISVLYLGEIVRHILATQGGLFSERTTPALLTKGSVQTRDILEITDEQVGLVRAQCVLRQLGLEASDQDCFSMQQVCSTVCIRAASLCAAGLAAILSHMCRNRELTHLKTSVAVDGAMFRDHAKFSQTLQQLVKQLAPECDVTLVQAEDGSGKGIAMVAAVASRQVAQRLQVNQTLALLQLSPDALGKVQALLRREMELGLKKETHAMSSVRMLPTYICATPDGSERGNFLALDLGGTNFRVLLVQVGSREQGGVQIVSEVYSIPPYMAQGPGSQLFDHIVECIMDFQAKQGMMGQTLPLGFTFSFPCQHTGLDQGVLLSWTKGFNASDCVGQDVVKLLREAVKRKNHFALDVVAIVNDTVGTMMSCGYDDPSCEVGLIVGTGTNACYMEELRNVGTLAGGEGRMCVNMEWGAFGDNGCLDAFVTPFDRQVDEASLNPGRQRFEKLISGMYLGEIVRRILLELTAKGLLFRGRPSPKLQTRDIFQTKFLSSIESDGLALRQVCAILEGLGLHVTCEDSVLVREVCQVVARRAAQLCGAGVAAVVEKIRENRGLEQLSVTVGVDGTLYKLHPHFAQEVQKTVQLLAPRCSVTFLRSEDGSGKGAALIAAVACRVARHQQA